MEIGWLRQSAGAETTLEVVFAVVVVVAAEAVNEVNPSVGGSLEMMRNSGICIELDDSPSTSWQHPVTVVAPFFNW